MYLSTDTLHDLRHASNLKVHASTKSTISYIYLKIKEQSQERYEFVVSYDQGFHLDPNRL